MVSECAVFTEGRRLGFETDLVIDGGILGMCWLVVLGGQLSRSVRSRLIDVQNDDDACCLLAPFRPCDCPLSLVALKRLCVVVRS